MRAAWQLRAPPRACCPSPCRCSLAAAQTQHAAPTVVPLASRHVVHFSHYRQQDAAPVLPVKPRQVRRAQQAALRAGREGKRAASPGRHVGCRTYSWRQHGGCPWCSWSNEGGPWEHATTQGLHAPYARDALPLSGPNVPQRPLFRGGRGTCAHDSPLASSLCPCLPRRGATLPGRRRLRPAAAPPAGQPPLRW